MSGKKKERKDQEHKNKIQDESRNTKGSLKNAIQKNVHRQNDFLKSLKGVIQSDSPELTEDLKAKFLEQSKCKCGFNEFKDYCNTKAFEVIGDDNQYKKYFSQCRENAEPWALKVHQSISHVVSEIKAVHSMIENLQTQGKDKIYRLCMEVIASSNPPLRKKNGWNICSISGTRSDACLEIGRRGKDTSLILVHQKFSAFILNLWFVCKLEHIVKHQAKSWVNRQGTEDVFELCKNFESEDEMVNKWYSAFCDAVRHVKLSVLIESSV